MARRLALLAMLACAVTANRPVSQPTRYSYSESESYDIFDDSYDDSTESSQNVIIPPLRPSNAKPSAKVILRTNGPKVNTTVKNTKSENTKKVIKTTNINIESHTNFIVTKAPSTTKKLQTTKTPPRVPVKRVSSLRPPTKTSRRPPTTTRRAPTRRTTVRPRRPNAPTKTSQQKKTTCPSKHSNWLTSFFQDNKFKNTTTKKPTKAGWFLGFFKSIYNWIWGPSGSYSWFSGFFNGVQKKGTTTITTSTTPAPPLTTTTNWFYTLLDSEEDDGAYVVNDKKKIPKKSLKKNYKGYQLLRAYPDVQWKVHELLDLEEEADGSGLMWWTPPSLNGSTDMLVPPDLLSDIKDHLKSLKIDFDVVIWDLQKAMMYENPRLSKKQRLELEQLRGHPMTWRRYHRYADILRYLEYIQHSYPDLVELIPLGRSSEGRPLVAVKVSLPANDSLAKDTGQMSGRRKKWKLRSRMKPAVLLEGGTHAREWISPAVVTWILHALVEGDKAMDSQYEMLEQADFYILPVMNPDGYEHSHTHDRLWRKTRSRHSDVADDYYIGWFPWNWGRTECVGVDADRNWDYHWGEADSSRDPCSEHYAGPHPFSEPETRALSVFLSEHRDRMKVYLSLHAYSQFWLVPSTHAQATFSDDGVLVEMGKLATAALSDVFGTKYKVGTNAELRQPASGMSHDWAKARAGVKFSYHVDLRDSFGPHGFLLPGSQIVPTARETMQAIRAIVDNLAPG